MRLENANAEDTCLTNQPRQNDGNTSETFQSQALNIPPLIEQNDRESANESQQNNAVSPERNAEDTEDFPEGGLRAWSVVVGSFCGQFAVYGVLDSTGVFQEYFSTHQLQQYSAGQIGWIFSISLFITFFVGLFVGPIFDSRGPKLLMLCGSVLSVASLMLVGLCTTYWQFILVFSIVSGFGGAFLNTPTVAAVGHFFNIRRGYATGLATTSGNIGGVIIPLMMEKLIPQVGFAWATRILGFVVLFLLFFSNLLLRSRLPRKKTTDVWPDLTVFKDLKFAFITLAMFLLEWGIFIPIAYISSYAVAHGMSLDFSFEILSLLNAASFVGHIAAGWIADHIGRFNTFILTITICAISNLALWLPTGDSQALLIVFALAFGFASGSNLSLAPVCIGQLCPTERYGRYFSTGWTVASFGTLTGLPIAGAILTANDGDYSGLIIFAGVSYAAALACVVTSRVMAVGWRFNVAY